MGRVVPEPIKKPSFAWWRRGFARHAKREVALYPNRPFYCRSSPDRVRGAITLVTTFLLLFLLPSPLNYIFSALFGYLTAWLLFADEQYTVRTEEVESDIRWPLLSPFSKFEKLSNYEGIAVVPGSSGTFCILLRHPDWRKTVLLDRIKQPPRPYWDQPKPEQYRQFVVSKCEGFAELLRVPNLERNS